MLNFVPTPSWIMNELFSLPTTHYVLQNMIYVFTLHPCSTCTQKNCWHYDKIYAQATWIISNYHIVTFVVGEYDVDSSIPQRLDVYKGENSRKEK
jgi:hypothetical protein